MSIDMSKKGFGEGIPASYGKGGGNKAAPTDEEIQEALDKDMM